MYVGELGLDQKLSK